MKLAEKILEKVDIRAFDDVLNDFVKPMIHLKKFSKFELKDDPKAFKEVAKLVSEMEAILSKLDRVSDKLNQ
jgi:DNA-directed RNA polymerase subunit F